MEKLIDVLMQYAAENLVFRFGKETALQTQEAWEKVDELIERLEALGPEEKQWMKELKKELSTIDLDHERTTLLAGISIGLELGRL